MLWIKIICIYVMNMKKTSLSLVLSWLRETSIIKLLIYREKRLNLFDAQIVYSKHIINSNRYLMCMEFYLFRTKMEQIQFATRLTSGSFVDWISSKIINNRREGGKMLNLRSTKNKVTWHLASVIVNRKSSTVTINNLIRFYCSQIHRRAKR